MGLAGTYVLFHTHLKQHWAISVIFRNDPITWNSRACYELTPVPKAGNAFGSMRITKIRKCNPASTSGNLS